MTFDKNCFSVVLNNYIKYSCNIEVPDYLKYFTLFFYFVTVLTGSFIYLRSNLFPFLRMSFNNKFLTHVTISQL